tara:strand:- start:5251 stop:6270 length:1020 start_codon:yes stop_codon:yes gene_type:complete
MKITLLGAKGTTLDLLNNLVISKKVDITNVVTLSKENSAKNKVAFYKGTELVDYCESNGIDVHVTSTYHMNSEVDLDFFKQLKTDLLLVIGWERVVPNQILKTLGKFACGMHGSAFGLPKGRGRSPLNWSLITGHRKFTTYLFRYNPEIDAGDIIGFKTFDINEFDNIASLHAKNRNVMQQLVTTYVPLIDSGEVEFFKQPPLESSFYPKRTMEDGFIDWNSSSEEIYNLIRAVSFPYPSAFTFTEDSQKLVIDVAFPFDTALFNSNVAPGTIVDISISLNQFVIKTGTGSLLVSQFSGIDINKLAIESVLKSGDNAEIIQNITTRYDEGIVDDQKEIK